MLENVITEKLTYTEKSPSIIKHRATLFDHEKLDVYHIGVEFVILADSIIENLPRGRGYLSDQLQRAALSIPLNIAEGAGEYSSDEKARFYRIAKRSATECAGILDVTQKKLYIRTRIIDQNSLYIDKNGTKIALRSRCRCRCRC